MTRGSVGEQRLDDESVLLMPLNNELDICNAARIIWTTQNGTPRAAPSAPRVDTGKPKSTNPFSEASFTKRRRIEVQRAAASLNPSDCTQPEPRIVGELDWEEHSPQIRQGVSSATEK
jgi:hypothetical protein